jgi:hypothetical protein
LGDLAPNVAPLDLGRLETVPDGPDSEDLEPDESESKDVSDIPVEEPALVSTVDRSLAARPIELLVLSGLVDEALGFDDIPGTDISYPFDGDAPGLGVEAAGGVEC